MVGARGGGILPDSLRVTIDGSMLGVPLSASPTQILFVRTDPALREFQLDGSDSINNFSEDLNYIHSIENSPYYRFQAWMRDPASYSSWRSISVRAAASGRLTSSVPVADTSTLLSLPGGRAIVSASIERLEIPVEIDVFCGKSECSTIQIDRNDRFVQVQSLLPDGTTRATQKAFFPYTALPFVADVANVLIHTLIWSLLLHVPWLVEPVLGSCALFGIYKMGRLMFSPPEALLALDVQSRGHYSYEQS